jgi:diguanylate cyclase (GGDEF)-like protein/PAS domain S-box-containing protein
MRLPIASIRTKVAVATAFLVAVISVFIYAYFPSRLRDQASKATTEAAFSITQMGTVSVAPGLSTGDKGVVYQALAALRENRDIAYVIVIDGEGRLFAGMNQSLAERYGYRSLQSESRDTLDPRSEARRGLTGGFSRDGVIYQTHAPVLYRGRPVGELYIGLSTAQLAREVRESRRTVGWLSVAIFGIGVVLAIVISAAITHPVRAIAETTNRIAAGDLKERAPIRGRDEVAQLATAFNKMVSRLADAQEELAQRYRALFERNLAGVYMARLDGRIVSCNTACARMLGYISCDELLAGDGAIQYFDPTDHQQMTEELLERGSVVNHEAQLLRRDGDVVWVLETLSLSAAENNDPLVEGIVLDITDRKRGEQEVEYQAYHDALTGLPNRMLFMDRLTVAVAQARRRHQSLALMFLDLDDLKLVNDTLGHPGGDHLLQMVAERLSALLRQEDTVARIGGDEFTILLPELPNASDAAAVADKVIASIQEPFIIGDDDVHITTSIGIAIYPADGEDPDTLLASADGTMYRAKETGGASYQFSSSTLPRRTLGRMTMEESLKHAVERGEFVVHYQPQVDARTRDVVGVEALVRWLHPEAGLIAPAGFISLAEYTGLIISIGEWVLREACRQTVEWHNKGLPHLRVGVNVSARQFHQHDFLGMIDRSLEATKLPPHALELEITESVAMQKSTRTIQMLTKLRDRGIAIALDDFGTGQSSLTYLKRFPVNTVKIDRSFVADVEQAVIDAPILEAILHLASSLGLRTIAEGIETAEQWDFLASRGCSEIQGYFVSRPVPAEAFFNFASTRRAMRAS